MSAIAYYLEAEGIATTGISLVRENTVSFAPPRFLWVSFPLGRPLGEPDNPGLQHRVITHALTLLERGEGPVLEEFPEDAKPVVLGGADDVEPLACPVSFGASDAADDTWQARLTQEVKALMPWYEAGASSRARTTFGIVGESPAALAALLGEALDADAVTEHPIKHVFEDLKAFYTESMLAQPGADAVNLNRWLWLDTELGRSMIAMRTLMLESDAPKTRALAESLAPRWVVAAHEST